MFLFLIGTTQPVPSNHFELESIGFRSTALGPWECHSSLAFILPTPFRRSQMDCTPNFFWKRFTKKVGTRLGFGFGKVWIQSLEKFGSTLGFGFGKVQWSIGTVPNDTRHGWLDRPDRSTMPIDSWSTPYLTPKLTSTLRSVSVGVGSESVSTRPVRSGLPIGPGRVDQSGPKSWVTF